MTTTIGLFRNATEFVTFSAGQAIFQVGDPGHEMYVVKEGEVDIVLQGKLVETVGQGGLFGELALIDSQPRSGTAVARTDVQLVVINERRFVFLVSQTPQFALQVMRIMAGRLRRAGAPSI